MPKKDWDHLTYQCPDCPLVLPVHDPSNTLERAANLTLLKAHIEVTGHRRATGPGQGLREKREEAP